MNFPFIGKKNTKAHCALYLQSDNVVLAYRKSNQELVVQKPIHSIKDWALAVKELVHDQGISNLAVVIVLSSEHYQLIQIERPEVPEEELSSALPWTVKDMLADDPSNYVFDYYDCVTASNVAKRINVIAVMRSIVLSVIELCNKQALSIKAITCENVVLGNLLASDDKTRLVLWQPKGSELEIIVICNSDILFQRQLRGYSKLPSLQEIEFSEDIFDNLSLELQRSVDYLRSTLKQSAITSIEVAISSAYVDSICTKLQENFAIPVNMINYEVQDISVAEIESKQFCQLAAIAGLREEL